MTAANLSLALLMAKHDPILMTKLVASRANYQKGNFPMDSAIHNVISTNSTVEKIEPHDGIREPYFIHKLSVTSIDHKGAERVETLTLFSNNNDEVQITLFPEAAS